MQGVPEKFERLHEGEEFIRSRSYEAISRSPDLLIHLSVIETAMDFLNHYGQLHSTIDDNDKTIQSLSMRSFNTIASSLTLCLSGYYQSAASLQRDLLETAFLIDYFSIDSALIDEWRNSERSERQKNFSPAAIRRALDDRDGYTDQKRRKKYQFLSEIAAHPSYEGFQMLSPVPGRDGHCGPFFEQGALKAVLEELVSAAVQVCTAINVLFVASSAEDYQTKIDLLEAFGSWAQRFLGHSFNSAELQELKKLLASYRGTSSI